MLLACIAGVPGSNPICITLSAARELHALHQFHHTNAEVLSSVEKEGTRCGRVVQALRYKSEGRRFVFQIGLLGFFIDLIIPGDSASNRSEYQWQLLGVGG